MNGKLIAYYRVSTARQGHSDLDLDAQRKAVKDYLEGGQWKLLKEFIELESGPRNTRPELGKAIHECRLTGATLVIARLNRLSRSAAFLLTLRDAGVRFTAVDIPEADNTTVGIMALIAEREREMTSRRTQEALAAAKRRGVKLGNPNGAQALRRAHKGNTAAIAARQAKADALAEQLRQVITDARAEGAETLQELAAMLNALGITSARGGQWYPSSVRNLVARIER